MQYVAVCNFSQQVAGSTSCYARRSCWEGSLIDDWERNASARAIGRRVAPSEPLRWEPRRGIDVQQNGLPCPCKSKLPYALCNICQLAFESPEIVLLLYRLLCWYKEYTHTSTNMHIQSNEYITYIPSIYCTRRYRTPASQNPVPNLKQTYAFHSFLYLNVTDAMIRSNLKLSVLYIEFLICWIAIASEQFLGRDARRWRDFEFRLGRRRRLRGGCCVWRAAEASDSYSAESQPACGCR